MTNIWLGVWFLAILVAGGSGDCRVNSSDKSDPEVCNESEIANLDSSPDKI